MKNLLTEIARQLVDYPEKVVVREIDGDQTLVLEISVVKSDLGKVIGKQGRNIQAVRTIINAASAKIKKRVIVELLE